MFYHLKIYRTLIKLNFSALLAYRFNFINDIIGSITWGSFHFISIFLLTAKSGSVYGWSREELILLTASFSFIWGFFHIFFGKNFERIADIIHYGQLDQLLLKPIDSQFLLSLYYVNFTGIIRLILGMTAILIILAKIRIAITFVTVLGYLTLIFCGLILIYSLWYIITSLIIWFTRLTNLVDLLFNISGISRYPPEMMKRVQVYFFPVLLPILIFVSTPTKVLLHKVLLGDVLQLIGVTLVFFLISRWFWRFALRYYTSASS